MSTEPVYSLETTEAVDAFLNGLDPEIRAVVARYFDLIAHRRILPEIVQSVSEPRTYKVNIPSGETPGWRSGLRIFFTVRRSTMTVKIADVGDHATCASLPGRSIYPDERQG